VKYAGRWFTLGPVGSDKATKEYARLVTLWKGDPYAVPISKGEYLVAELCLDFLRSGSFAPNTKDRYRRALIMLCERNGHLTAESFGPVALATWQRELADRVIESGPRSGERLYSRSTVSMYVRMVRTAWKWAVATERIQPERHAALVAVRGLRPDQGRDGKKLDPAPEADIAAVLGVLPRSVAGLVRLQRATGARPSELFHLRPSDLDRAGEVWKHRPKKHKTSGKGKYRAIHLGPQCQNILREHWPNDEGDLFFPVEPQPKRPRVVPVYGSEVERRAAEKARRTPRRFGQAYCAGSYRVAIGRACERVGVAVWTPYQLRHARLTEIWNADGAEASAAIGGHGLKVNEFYTRQRDELAERVAAASG
jgi:integrase